MTNEVSSIDARARNNGRSPGLPQTLHKLLEETEAEGRNDIISWVANGTAFKVHNKEAFINTIMPRYFETSTFKSYQRSVNLWSFTTVRKGPKKGYTSHPLFRRGEKDLCKDMRRIRIKGTGRTRVALPADPPNPTSTSKTTLATLNTSKSPGTADRGETTAGFATNGFSHLAPAKASEPFQSSSAGPRPVGTMVDTTTQQGLGSQDVRLVTSWGQQPIASSSLDDRSMRQHAALVEAAAMLLAQSQPLVSTEAHRHFLPRSFQDFGRPSFLNSSSSPNYDRAMTAALLSSRVLAPSAIPPPPSLAKATSNVPKAPAPSTNRSGGPPHLVQLESHVYGSDESGYASSVTTAASSSEASSSLKRTSGQTKELSQEAPAAASDNGNHYQGTMMTHLVHLLQERDAAAADLSALLRLVASGRTPNTNF